MILQRLRDAAAHDPGLAAGKVAALAEQDAAKGTAWVQTLRAYFDAFGDMASAAAQVNVHPNTFRYRLRRITEVFGLDLSDPDERLVAELAAALPPRARLSVSHRLRGRTDGVPRRSLSVRGTAG